ncbi:DUF4276 family protein [Desulfatirhabdium butyrativorans]|uniref:DUF4276 family protein n=1 Tax=Desulfatirhabdium butyrativorans TaxID=340467 RepID=UPI000482374B|nr:DUF4276 family protein [Desulfatirhabdium butyrativorans]
MIRVHVICEGQTEEEFIRHLLGPVLLEKQISLLPSCIGKVGHKGGNVNLRRLAMDVRERLLRDQQCYCTTMLDYYGLPAEFPGKAEGAKLHDISDKQKKVVEALAQWAGDNLGPQTSFRFIPYIQMYEFEGLLFSDPSALAGSINNIGAAEDFKKVRADFPTPEWINDNPHTAPSKRIAKLFPAYDKPEHPLMAAQDIGLDTIRRECPLFDSWVKRLEGLSAGGDA